MKTIQRRITLNEKVNRVMNIHCIYLSVAKRKKEKRKEKFVDRRLYVATQCHDSRGVNARTIRARIQKNDNKRFLPYWRT